MVLDLYWTVGSPPCHAVQMTAKAVGVDLNLKSVNLAIGEHLKEDFLKVHLTKVFKRAINILLICFPLRDSVHFTYEKVLKS